MDIIIFTFIVLKYIVYTIIIILTFLLFLLLVILFVPIKYYIIISKDENLDITAKITWIFSIIKILFIQNKNESKTIVTFFGFRLGKVKKLFKYKIKNKKIKNDIKKDSEKEVIKNSDIANDIRSSNEEYDEQKVTITEKYKKFVLIYKNCLRHIKFIKVYERKKEIFNLTIYLFKKLYKSLNIKIYNCKVEVGLGEKHKTGQLLGLCAVIFGLLCLDVNLKGNFEQKILRVSATVKGKMLLSFIIYYVIIYIIKKPIWKILKLFLRKEWDK